MVSKKTPNNAPAPAKAPAKSAPTDAPQASAAAVDVQAPQRESDPVPAPVAPAAPEAPAAPARRTPVRASGRYVVGSVPIRHDGKAYGVGYAIELTDAQAERLGDLVAPTHSKE